MQMSRIVSTFQPNYVVFILYFIYLFMTFFKKSSWQLFLSVRMCHLQRQYFWFIRVEHILIKTVFQIMNP